MDTLLTVNGGSSSLKCALYAQAEGALDNLYTFKLANILGDARISVLDAQGECIHKEALDLTALDREERHQAALHAVLNWIDTHCPASRLTGFGHRVVHGGEQFSAPVLIDNEALAALEAFIPLAPLHQPYNLKLIRACQALAPALPQVACFDTMFHVSQPKVERNYALPRKFSEAGIHRYGFHGLSYEFIQRQLDALGSGQLNTIICHLGAGASMCAVKGGRSVASTMGFTAVDGLPMGSRCGNIDPGVLLYLQRHYGMDADALEALLNKESGWLGVSGVSADMLELHRSDNPHAEEAIEMFAYRIALELGRLGAALQGPQQIVFTGGIGENDADLRRRVLDQAHWLGIRYDGNANSANAAVISLPDSAIAVRVIPTNEEAMIAQHVREVLDY
jgi:acetate kinase